MDVALLTSAEDRDGSNYGDEEEELLWNELKDNEHSKHPNEMKEEYIGQHGESLPSTHALPSLRSNVHIPAISHLYQDLKATFIKSGTNRSNYQWNSTHTPDASGHVQDVDGFLINLYNYYYHKGFWIIFFVEVTSLCTGLFSITFSSFLLGCVQWHKLMECTKDTEHGCHVELEAYMTCSTKDPSFYHLAIAFYFTIFLLYWSSRVFRFLQTLRDTRAMSIFYRERLHIDEQQIQSIPWDEIVNRVLSLLPKVGNNLDPLNHHRQQFSSYQLDIDPQTITSPYDIARRILRRENYMIACMNHALFHSPQLIPLPLQWASISTTHVMFSKNMECNLNICLVDYMFDENHNLKADFLADESKLQRRFMIAGVINLILAPFLLLYRSIHFFLVSAQDWHLNKVPSFGARRWSAYALWKFREYNELPHVLEQRMAASYAAAENYISLFPTRSVAVIAGGISFVASSIMIVLLCVSVVEESVLLDTTLMGRQLIWYLTIFGGLFAFARSFTTSSPSLYLPGGDYETAMENVAAQTHYFPKEWRGRCYSHDVHDALLTLFPYKAVLFIQECLSVLFAPYLLCIALPSNAREILLFLKSHSIVTPRAINPMTGRSGRSTGTFCRFAEFDFKMYAHDMKMESSFLHFRQLHPKWNSSTNLGGEQLINRINRLKEQEMEKSMQLDESTIQPSGPMTISQQLLQSQAIHTAMGGSSSGFGMGMSMNPLFAPQEREFYWLDKLHQQENNEPPSYTSISSLEKAVSQP